MNVKLVIGVIVVLVLSFGSFGVLSDLSVIAPFALLVFGVFRMRAVVAERLGWGWTPGGTRGDGPAVHTKLVTEDIDSEQLRDFFGGELPADWVQLMKGVLFVLESVALPIPADISKNTARERWLAGPVPQLVKRGTPLLNRYSTSVITSLAATTQIRNLTVLLSGGDDSQLELSWTVAVRSDGIVRTLRKVTVL